MNKKFLSKFPRNLLALVLSISFLGTAFAAAPPSQVAGVEARLVGDNSVSLSWEEATSDEGVVVGYKIYFGKTSVTDEGVLYDDEIEVAAQTSYPIENLDRGETYYFAITALDDELNQSLNYSEEVSIEIPQGENVVEVVEEEVEEEIVEKEVVENLPVVVEEEPVVEENQSEEEVMKILEELEKSSAPVDVVSPADIKSLVVDKSTLKNSDSVSIRWKKSANIDGDVADQLFYVKKGASNWDQGYSIGKDLEEMVFDVEVDKDYMIRIITVDESGNRSNGATLSFSTEVLATTGPGMMIPLAVLAIVMFFFLSFRRQS